MRDERKERKAILTGSFDPFTKGHENLVRQALRLADRLVIAIGHNIAKPGWIPLPERLQAISQLYRDEPRISVTAYEGLTVDIVRETQADLIVRGVRSIKDYEYETQMALVNARLLPQVQTVLLPADPSLGDISSSTVRELAAYHSPAVLDFLPEGIHYPTIVKMLSAYDQK